MRKELVLAFILPILSISRSGLAENWAQWRGPNQNGSSPEVNLPESLDPEKTLVWKVAMPGHSAGTPVVWEERIFVGSLDRDAQKLLALCVDAKTGKILWQREVGEGGSANRRHNFTGPSPITDGKTVWFYYGTGDLAAFDMQGNALWARNVQKDHGTFNVFWIYSSSPLLYDGKLYVQVLHRDGPAQRRRRGPDGRATPLPVPAGKSDSYLLIIDPASGKDLCKQTRPTTAQAESMEAYTTPIAYEGAGRKEVILVGGDCVTGHDAETGEELWRMGGWNPESAGNWRVVPPPVIVDGKLIFCTPQNQSRTIAINLGGSGDVSHTHKLWENEQAKSDVPAPLVYQGNVYVLDGDWRKGLICLDPNTGQTKWTTPLTSRSPLRTSPTGADGKIYIMNEQGQVWVLSAADGKVLSTTTLETKGLARSSIVAANGRVYARTGSVLYCFGKGE